jgi:Outer membrane protein beta-barrel domain
MTVMRFALLLGLILQPFMINDAAAESTAIGSTVPGSHRLEAFGGYSYLHFDSGLSSAQLPTTSMGMNGWIVAGTYNVSDYFGVTAEFSGQYAGDLFGLNTRFTPPFGTFSTHVHNFLFGPTLTYRKKAKIAPFGRILLGDSHGTILNGNPSFNVTTDTFALAAGGGVDYRVSKRLAVRLGQFDYLHTNFNFSRQVTELPTSQNHFRYSAGIVIRAF